MRIVFMGTPEFAVASLDLLVKSGCNIVAVVTVPDKPAGRGQQLQESAVKKYATERSLKILQPEKLKEEHFLDELRNLKADLQIVVAFRMLPEVVWNMPPKGTFNLHGSLLPQYRGAAPINRAVMNGETETGVSTFFLQHEIDTGKIIFREKVEINENESAGEVHDKLMIIGADLVLKTVRAIEAGSYTETAQDILIAAGEKEKHAPKIFKEDCRVNWLKEAEEIHNHIRGLSPYPAAFTDLLSPDGKVFPFKIFISRKELCTHGHQVKSITTDAKTIFKIAVQNGYIIIEELQISGKKRMPVADFLRGFPLTSDWTVL
ncbi:MAG: methionyl-tRNA formyltransferase [Bacteroidota bacterium]|nr:methionyl-tRNA formyltransferase [Bacteroidota bacterium]